MEKTSARSQRAGPHKNATLSRLKNIPEMSGELSDQQGLNSSIPGLNDPFERTGLI